MDEADDLRNTALTDALQTQDLAAVAFALRHGTTVVPLLPPGASDRFGAGVWTFTEPGSGDTSLLLFSAASHVPASMPQDVGVRTPGWLRAFLRLHEDQIANVFLDIAGPHAMRATPRDMIDALDA